MIEMTARLLAGLGLYFTGVGGIRTSLQQISGRKFRDFIGKATAHPLSAAWNGFLMGAVTQTSIGVTVILAGLISRGMATVSQALPVVAWSNLGLVVLVFLNNLPVHLLAMTLIGLCGICLNFGLGGRFKGFMGPLFALGTVLFGLRLIKESMQGLSSMPEIAAIIGTLSHANWIAFLLGLILRIPIQSSSAVALIGITLHSAGIFRESEAMMMLYGTAMGSAASVFLLTAHFKGVMRQITLFEAIINGLAGAVMLVLFYLERTFGQHVVVNAVQASTQQVDTRLALAFLLQQSLCVGFAYLLLPRAERLLERLAPTTVEQDLSRPRFIHDEAVQDIETALSLAEQELTAILSRTPGYLDHLRSDRETGSSAAPPTEIQHSAAVAVMGEVGPFLGELSARRFKSHNTSVALLQIQRRVNLIEEIEDAVYQIARDLGCVARPREGSPMASFMHNIAESLDMLLNTAVQAASGKTGEAELLHQLTAAPGEVIEELRHRYLSESQEIDHAGRALILAVTSQHERVMLTLHQLGRALQRNSSSQ